MLASSRTSLAVCHVSIEARRDRARLAARVRVPAVTVACMRRKAARTAHQIETGQPRRPQLSAKMLC